MSQRFLTVVCLCVVLVVLGGCSKRYRIEVQSDTCWQGSVDNTNSLSGCGSSSYKVVGPMHCVQLQKQSVLGALSVRIDGGPWSKTTDSYGIVVACK